MLLALDIVAGVIALTHAGLARARRRHRSWGWHGDATKPRYL